MSPIELIFQSTASTITGGIIADLILAIGAIVGIELIILGYLLVMKVLHPKPTLWIKPYGTHEDVNDEDDFSSYYDNKSDRKFQVSEHYDNFREGKH